MGRATGNRDRKDLNTIKQNLFVSADTSESYIIEFFQIRKTFVKMGNRKNDKSNLF